MADYLGIVIKPAHALFRDILKAFRGIYGDIRLGKHKKFYHDPRLKLLASRMDDISPLSQELELLAASYSDEFEISDTFPPSLTFRATPHLSTADAPVFVSLTLNISIDENYPSHPACFKVLDAYGLDDPAIESLVEVIRKEAVRASDDDELHISNTLSMVSDFLSERNRPNACPVCLESIDTNAEGHMGLAFFVPCHHAIHVACYKGYERQLYEQRKERERILTFREGARRASLMAGEGWAVCPICRTVFDVDAIQELVKRSSGKRASFNT